MEKTSKELDANSSARELRGYKILFWVFTPVFVIGFLADPFSSAGLRNAFLAMIVWKLFYIPSSNKQRAALAGIRIPRFGWLFIAACTLMLPLLHGLGAPVDWFVWGFLGFMGSAVLVMVVAAFTGSEGAGQKK